MAVAVLDARGGVVKPVCLPPLAAWHNTATAKCLLDLFDADGFPSHCTKTDRGIWEDRTVREYDREDCRVAALIAARDMWFEAVGEANWTDADFATADDIIELRERYCEWRDRFVEVIDVMELEFPPNTSGIWALIDLAADPVEEALLFVAESEAERQARIAAWRAEQTNGWNQ